MKQVKMTCPRCKEKFQTAQAELYECPKCGTNIRPKAKTDDSGNMDKTQQIKL